MNKNKLLQVSTPDGLYLDGYYVPSVVKKVGVLFVHGMNGSFCDEKFVYTLADKFEEKGIGFLTGNNRGNGKDTEFHILDGKYKRIGSRYELLEEAHLDITAWLKFLVTEGYSQIVLIGHSAGTVKIIRYLFEGELIDKVNKLILLAPFDPLAMRISKGRTNIEDFLEQALMKVKEGRGEELITPDFDHDVLSYKTFLSWYKQDDFGRMFEFFNKDYDFPVLKKIKIPTKIISGTKDEYFHPSNPDHPEEAMEILLKNILNSTGKIINGAGHSFYSYEEKMVNEVCEFILEGHGRKK